MCLHSFQTRMIYFHQKEDVQVVQIIYIYIHFHELKYDIKSILGVGLVHVKIHPFYIIRDSRHPPGCFNSPATEEKHPEI